MHLRSQSLPQIPTILIDADSNYATQSERQFDIYNSHRHHVYSVAYYMTGNELEAEKILESTFIEALQPANKNPGLKHVDQALLGQLQQRFPLEETAVVASDATATQQAMVGNVRRTDLEEAVRELSATERLFFLLRDVEGYSAERIAELTSQPVQIVRQTVHAARLHLRQQLSLQTTARAAENVR